MDFTKVQSQCLSVHVPGRAEAFATSAVIARHVGKLLPPLRFRSPPADSNEVGSIPIEIFLHLSVRKVGLSAGSNLIQCHMAVGPRQPLVKRNRTNNIFAYVIGHVEAAEIDSHVTS